MADIDSLVNRYSPGDERPAATPSSGVDSLVDRYSSQPSAQGSDLVDYGDSKEAEGPGLGEAVARGVGQGVTLNFKDELTAGLESLLTAKSYKQSLAESRANDEAARKAHPWGFGIGEAIGGLATPGIGEATGLVKGAGLAAHAARGAIIGGVAGLGNSTADLAGGDIAGAAKDTAAGGLMGAGIGAIVGKGMGAISGGAEERVAARAEGESKPSGALGKALDVGILFHNPAAYVAKKVGEKALGAAGRGADELLARISRAARAGEPTARFVQEAINAGAPRSAIATAVAAGE